MIKLYVTLRSDYSDRDREYEISNELAELLRHWTFRETWDSLTDEERTCDKFDLDIEEDEIYDMLNSQDDIPESVTKELKSITADAKSEAYELAVGCTIDDNPPTEFFLDERMPEDIEAGLFTPSLSFEQFLEKEDCDPSDEDFDEEWARDDYNEMIFDEYQKWVDALPPSDRAERWGLDNWEIVGDYSYVFESVNKAVNVTIPKISSRATEKQNKREEYTIVDGKCIIDDGVTVIGPNFFKDDSIKEELQFVEIPVSVKKIGDHAFDFCSNLKNIEIPSSVTEIGDSAFYECSGLTSIVIPSSVKEIGDSAFSFCSGLTSIVISSSVKKIGCEAFFGCTNLAKITVSPKNKYFDSRDNSNAIISSESNTLLFGCKNTFIPSSVTEIGDSAFSYCSGLTSIVIPSSVKEIGCAAFKDCANLAKITVSPENKYFDSRDNCNAIISSESNTLLYGCQNTLIPDSVKKIGGDAFWGCSGLKNIEIPSSVTEIGEYAFYECSGLTSIVIPSSVKEIGGYAFAFCGSLTHVEIHPKVKRMGNTFIGCDSLKDIVKYED